MKRKIIHILCHTIDNDEKRDYHVFGNWASRLARNISHYTKKYDHEVWYAVRHLTEKKEWREKDITYKLFPAETLYVGLESFYAIIKCPLLFETLKNVCPDTTIINIQGERGNLIHNILERFLDLTVTIQYHGYGQPKQFDWLERLFITPIEKKTFLNVSHFFVHIRRRIQYLVHDVGISPKRVSYQNVGIDFNRFKPRDRKEARKKLGLPPDAFIMLYVGNLINTKGVDKIIQAYQKLKKKYPSLYLLFIGANKTDPLYDEAVSTADNILGVTDNIQLPLYYNAADLYCFYGNTKTIEYAGIGTAPTEALASNLNVISTNLIHLPDTIINRIGFVPRDFNDFVDKIEFLITHPDYRFKARDLVAPYTSLEYTTRHLLAIYEKLFST